MEKGNAPFATDNEETKKLEILPRFVGRYRIESLIEQGGMSLLYLGHDPIQQNPLAIKVLTENFLQYPEALSLFRQEAHLLQRLNHPNIVHYKDHGRWEKGEYLAIEYIEGHSLRHLIENSPPSKSNALNIIEAMSLGLSHLHEHGIIHKDIKPENILVTPHGIVKIIDFGVAQMIGEEGLSASKLVGTPVYMSPEQRLSLPLSPSSDLYSMAVIAYELLIGKFCWGALDLSLLDKEVQPLFDQAFQHDPNKRLPSIHDFMEGIKTYKEKQLQFESEGIFNNRKLWLKQFWETDTVPLITAPKHRQLFCLNDENSRFLWDANVQLGAAFQSNHPFPPFLFDCLLLSNENQLLIFFKGDPFSPSIASNLKIISDFHRTHLAESLVDISHLMDFYIDFLNNQHIHDMQELAILRLDPLHQQIEYRLIGSFSFMKYDENGCEVIEDNRSGPIKEQNNTKQIDWDLKKRFLLYTNNTYIIEGNWLKESRYYRIDKQAELIVRNLKFNCSDHSTRTNDRMPAKKNKGNFVLCLERVGLTYQ